MFQSSLFWLLEGTSEIPKCLAILEGVAGWDCGRQMNRKARLSPVAKWPLSHLIRLKSAGGMKRIATS